MLGLGQFHTAEHFFGGFAGQPCNVGKAALGIGQLTHGAPQFFRKAQFVQRIVELPGQLSDLVMDIGCRLRRGDFWRVHGFTVPFS